MKIKIKKLIEEAVVPVRAHPTDAGMDITATSKEVTSKFIEYGIGLSLEIPTGYVGLIFPRSSISKTNLTLANSIAVIDSNFRGEVRLRFDRRDHDSSSLSYNIGDRIGQIIIMPYPEYEYEVVEELDDTDRGVGSFGSTDSVKLEYKKDPRKGTEL